MPDLIHAGTIERSKSQASFFAERKRASSCVSNFRKGKISDWRDEKVLRKPSTFVGKKKYLQFTIDVDIYFHFLLKHSVEMFILRVITFFLEYYFIKGYFKKKK